MARKKTPFPRKGLYPTDLGPTEDEQTGALTGNDATMDEAEVGDAGNGADPYGADLTGGRSFIEDAPDEPADILPDEVRDLPEERRQRRAQEEITAQPDEPAPSDPSDQS
jgi:hypothetical protein